MPFHAARWPHAEATPPYSISDRACVPRSRRAVDGTTRMSWDHQINTNVFRDVRDIPGKK